MFIICDYTFRERLKETKLVSLAVSEELGYLLYALETWHHLILPVTVWGRYIIHIFTRNYNSEKYQWSNIIQLMSGW